MGGSVDARCRGAAAERCGADPRRDEGGRGVDGRGGQEEAEEAEEEEEEATHALPAIQGGGGGGGGGGGAGHFQSRRPILRVRVIERGGGRGGGEAVRWWWPSTRAWRRCGRGPRTSADRTARLLQGRGRRRRWIYSTASAASRRWSSWERRRCGAATTASVVPRLQAHRALVRAGRAVPAAQALLGVGVHPGRGRAGAAVWGGGGGGGGGGAMGSRFAKRER